MENRKLIYYLDDDLEDLAVFRDVVEDLGHEVSIFADGKTMLKTLAGAAILPDIIFLDIVMPVLDGDEIFHFIHGSDKWKQIPIVMISGHSPKPLIRHYLAAGAKYILKKPATVNEFRETLAYVLAIDWDTFQAFS